MIGSDARASSGSSEKLTGRAMMAIRTGARVMPGPINPKIPDPQPPVKLPEGFDLDAQVHNILSGHRGVPPRDTARPPDHP